MLTIQYNKETEEVEYISEGTDDVMNTSDINPFSLTKDCTNLITCEDMQYMKDSYELEND